MFVQSLLCAVLCAKNARTNIQCKFVNFFAHIQEQSEKITETKKFNPQIPTIIFACVRFLVFAILGKYSINNRTLWARSSVGRAPPF